MATLTVRSGRTALMSNLRHPPDRQFGALPRTSESLFQGVTLLRSYSNISTGMLGEQHGQRDRSGLKSMVRKAWLRLLRE